ncbi:MarR family winged helix-turn-helix transcriptional regulator [Fredinandcohnia sp. 179-A 10B2 NHS]
MEVSNLSLKLFVVLSRAYRSVNERVEEDVKGYGLNLTEFAVLELLYHKGETPIQHIGKKVLLSSGSITYVVDKLEKKNFLVRKPCPKDRRVTWASITEEGTKFMDEIFPKHQQAIESIVGGLTDKEKEEMMVLLKKLGYHAEKI